MKLVKEWGNLVGNWWRYGDKGILTLHWPYHWFWVTQAHGNVTECHRTCSKLSVLYSLLVYAAKSGLKLSGKVWTVCVGEQDSPMITNAHLSEYSNLPKYFEYQDWHLESSCLNCWPGILLETVWNEIKLLIERKKFIIFGLGSLIILFSAKSKRYCPVHK